MSTWYTQTLACVRCGHTFTATFARGIHAKRVPEVRAQILRGELHHVRCDHCNAIIDVHREVSYTDFGRFHWVQVETPDKLDTWAAAEQRALAMFDRAMQHGAPVIASLTAEFRVRVVFDLDELRERLLIWDASLDDALVECVKLACVRDRPDLMARGHRIRLRMIAADGSLIVAAVNSQDPRTDVARWTVPATVVDTATRVRAEWEASCPQLFGPGFVSIDRYLRLQ